MPDSDDPIVVNEEEERAQLQLLQKIGTQMMRGMNKGKMQHKEKIETAEEEKEVENLLSQLDEEVNNI